MASEIKKPIFHHLRGRAVNEEESIPKFFKDAPVLREIVRKQVSEESTKQDTKQLLTQTQESPNAEQSNPQDDANPLDCAVEYSDLNISEDKGVSPINGKNEISLDLEFKKEIDQGSTHQENPSVRNFFPKNEREINISQIGAGDPLRSNNFTPALSQISQLEDFIHFESPRKINPLQKVFNFEKVKGNSKKPPISRQSINSDKPESASPIKNSKPSSESLKSLKERLRLKGPLFTEIPASPIRSGCFSTKRFKATPRVIDRTATADSNNLLDALYIPSPPSKRIISPQPTLPFESKYRRSRYKISDVLGGVTEKQLRLTNLDSINLNSSKENHDTSRQNTLSRRLQQPSPPAHRKSESFQRRAIITKDLPDNVNQSLNAPRNVKYKVHIFPQSAHSITKIKAPYPKGHVLEFDDLIK